MTISSMIDATFQRVGHQFVHDGTIVLNDSNGVAQSLELSAELSISTSLAAMAAVTGSSLTEGNRVPTGLALTIDGDPYTTTADGKVADLALVLAITPAATSTYAAGTAVVLGDAVTWDLVALETSSKASTAKRDPSAVRTPTGHSATLSVLKSKLPGITQARLLKMELIINGQPAPILDVVNAAPFWDLLAGGAN